MDIEFHEMTQQESKLNRCIVGCHTVSDAKCFDRLSKLTYEASDSNMDNFTPLKVITFD